MFTFPACNFSSSSGGFTPPSVAGNVLWLDAADNTTITIATGVSQWNDKSGLVNNATQATGSAQPAYNTNPINSLATLTFNATSSVMVLPSLSMGGTTGFVVGNFNGSGDDGGWLCDNGGGSGCYYGNLSGTVYLFGDPSNFISGPVTRDSTARLNYYTSAPNNLSIFVDSTTIVSGGAGTITESYTRIGSRGPGEWLDGNIGEIILYNRILNGTEIGQVKGYLKTKWGTP